MAAQKEGSKDQGRPIKVLRGESCGKPKCEDGLNPEGKIPSESTQVETEADLRSLFQEKRESESGVYDMTRLFMGEKEVGARSLSDLQRVDPDLRGHMGVRKTLDRIWLHFYCPGIRKDIIQYCRSCHICQIVGKPDQPVAVAPLKLISVGEEPFAKSLGALGIVKVTASAYHPQSQDALKRYHQTLKSMPRKWCLENNRGWDQAQPYLLFAVREVPNESLGLSPFDTVFGHCVRGPFEVLKECLLEQQGASGVIKSVEEMRSRLTSCWQRARETLQSGQGPMKQKYDRKANVREFKQGDRVLVLLPFQSKPLRAKFSEPYVVTKRVGKLNYIVASPDKRRKQQLCHLNMLKAYQERDKSDVGESGGSVCTVSIVPEEDEDSISPTFEMTWKANADVWPQVPMAPRAQSIKCFTALGRTYQCNVMPFGMTNAPATFQRLMNNLTENIPGCLVSSNLVLNLTKCDFVKAKVHYLGYVIGQGEVAPPHVKVEAILNIATPQSKKEVRTFIGAIAYYRMFIYNSSSLLAPLTDLLKKGTKFQCTEACNSAFVQAKSLLCTVPVLQAPDFSEAFYFYCDKQKSCRIPYMSVHTGSLEHIMVQHV
ncbi:uncharacterized protein LOC143040447 [Oratosquilla oratoria]|uniref:uncharacterized protein LOC143040447 n=1 Tax=Oratosquilla oratoria TaxID=337810 RepID=UPI003F75EBDB